MVTVVIDGRLPGMNELIAKNRNSWQQGAESKFNNTQWCRLFFMNALRTGNLKPLKKKCDLYVVWYEPNRKRDPDNILAGLKFILDGAVKSGAIPDDSQKYIGEIHSVIRVDTKRPRVEITFKPV